MAQPKTKIELHDVVVIVSSCVKAWLKVGATLFITSISFSISAQNNLIPSPRILTLKEGFFNLNGQTQLFYSYNLSSSQDELLQFVEDNLGYAITSVEIDQDLGQKNAIYFNESDALEGEDTYYIEVREDQINISVSDLEAEGHAVETLKQLILQYGNKIPAMEIDDFPRFKHRGLLLDCSRHFFSVETVKKYIDLLAFYKMNVLHWHLTEDQGWRIQIDKYPKLTEVGAWRTEKDGSRYGGFYTKEEIKEIVEYASERHVTIIPEIELPGHSQAAIASYPWLSCTGEQVDVANDWGVFKEIYCAGNDSVFMFLEDVLTEVMELFPSEYIHIGGDEAPEFRWEHCAKCQKRMADEGLKDEHELQSYFITRIEKFLNKNGRQLIGWDEILEGGLSPNASVQSWRGMEHGKHAAEMKHTVVMSPTSHCYLDYGLDAINLEKVYGFNPIPEGLEKEFEQYILGGEVNMWSEHVPNDSVLDSKVFPRLIAMAEVLWSGPGGDFDDFYNRLQTHYPILKKMGVQFGLEAEPVSVSTFVEKGKTYVKITPGLPGLTIEYSPGDGLAHRYTKPFLLDKNMDLEVLAYKDKIIYGEPYRTGLYYHKALGKAKVKTPYSAYYPAGGDNGLSDGLAGSFNFRDGRWMGFSGEDAIVEIDFEKEIDMHSVQMNFYVYPNAWIMLPKTISLYTSEDGENWTLLKSAPFKDDFRDNAGHQNVYPLKLNLEPLKTRYLKVEATNYGPLPTWHDAAGSDAWIFIDEIIVR